MKIIIKEIQNEAGIISRLIFLSITNKQSHIKRREKLSSAFSKKKTSDINCRKFSIYITDFI